MKNTIKNKIAIITFFGLLILPTVLFFMLRGVIDTENHENRNYAAFPEISLANLKNIPGGIEDYYIDRVPFKNQFTSLNSKLEGVIGKKKSAYEMLGSLSTGADVMEDVAVAENGENVDYIDVKTIHDGENRESLLPVVTKGEEGWLYFTVLSNDSKEDAISEMFGKYKYNERQLRSIAKDYSDLSEYLKSQGTDFYFWLVPSKEQVYPEYLPEDYRNLVTEDTRGKQLMEYLQNNTDVNVCYPLEELKDAKGDILLYYKADTHWSQPGAYVGVQALLKTMGKDIKDLSDIRIEVATGEYDRDLARMINLNDPEENSYLYFVRDYTDTTVTMTEMNYESETIYDSSTSDSEDQRKVVIIGDSFLYVSDGIMRSFFGDFYLDRDWNRAAETIKRVKPDIVVFESNQRFYGRQETFPGEFLELLKN